MSQSQSGTSGRKDGKLKSNHQQSGNLSNSKSESNEIQVPKLSFAPNSNFHKWYKQILKQIKKEYGPIHDSIVEERYPDFAQESMNLILTSPEDILQQMTSGHSTRRKSISAPGRLSIMQTSTLDDSSDEDSEKKDDDLKFSSSPASLLKLSSKTPFFSKAVEGKDASCLNLPKRN